jgi:hypothetical protein
MDEARRIEQNVRNKRKVRIPKKIFLVGFERLSESGSQGLLPGKGKIEEILQCKGQKRSFKAVGVSHHDLKGL